MEGATLVRFGGTIVRSKLILVALVAAASAGCGSDDSSGGGGGGSGGGGSSRCSGSLSGAHVGSISGCIVTLNYYPDGGNLVGGRESSLLTLLVGSGIGTTPAGVDGVGVNFELAGAPAAGSYSLSDGGDATMAYVNAGASYFSNLDVLSLEVSQLQSLGEDTSSGERAESFMPSGTLDFVVSDGTGDAVTVSASF